MNVIGRKYDSYSKNTTHMYDLLSYSTSSKYDFLTRRQLSSSDGST